MPTGSTDVTSHRRRNTPLTRMTRAKEPAAPIGARPATASVAHLLDLVDDGVFTATPAGRLTYANAQLRRWLGPNCERRGSAWIGLLHSDESVWTVWRGAGRPDILDVSLRRADGARITAQARVRVIRGGDNAVVRFEGVIAVSPVHQRLARRLDRVKARLARRMTRTLATRLEERQGLARWLHDDIGHALVILKMEVDQLTDRHPAGGPAGNDAATVNAIRDSAATALRMVHSLCSELRSAPAGVIDLASLIEPMTLTLARRWRLASRVVTVGGRIRVEGRRALLVGDICREALTNVIRHAEATAITVRVMRRGPYFSVSVRDNGRGFSRAAIEHHNSFGVLGMRERAQALGGVLEITREDDHTVISVCAPLEVAGPTTAGVPA